MENLVPSSFYPEFLKFGSLAREMCLSNCSGHGDCLNGTCFCEIRFAGQECGGTNVSYHVGLASTYLFVALVSFTQLLISVLKSCGGIGGTKEGGGTGIEARIRQALMPTTPKAIYCVVFLAASLRAAYFAVSATWAADWLLSLLSAYYPLLLTGSSLIVCFWAERFHLRNVRNEFLSKSFLGFISFNILTYSILVMELLLVVANGDQKEKSYYLRIFNGCYAVLLFIVVVFFLIYGVEVYFKVRGGFVVQVLSPGSSKWSDYEYYPSSTSVSVSPNAHNILCLVGSGTSQPVDISQLNQSRLGLVSQASMLLVTVLFILSDVAEELWKDKVPVEGRNYHDLIFRIVEIGVALWFPCVLWNVNSPEQLWILNPKKLLKTSSPNCSSSGLHLPRGSCSGSSLQHSLKDSGLDPDYREKQPQEEKCGLSDNVGCYFCYDPDRVDAGPIIQPCECRGDVSSVHHECLRRWLVQKASESESYSVSSPQSCSVCKTPYRLEVEETFRWSSCSDVSAAHWLKFCLMVAAISGIFMSSWALCHVLPTPAYKLLVLGFAVVGVYVILKFLGQNTFAAYQQAKVSSVKIISRSKDTPSSSSSLGTQTEAHLPKPPLVLETKI